MLTMSKMTACESLPVASAWANAVFDRIAVWTNQKLAKKWIYTA